MDKTIEERIWNMAVDIGNNCVDFNGRDVDFCYIEDGLRQIAAEQKAIDDDHLRDAKKMVMDKACECYCDQLCNSGMSGMCFFKHDWKGQIKNSFTYRECFSLKLIRNAMEL